MSPILVAGVLGAILIVVLVLAIVRSGAGLDELAADALAQDLETRATRRSGGGVHATEPLRDALLDAVIRVDGRAYVAWDDVERLVLRSRP